MTDETTNQPAPPDVQTPDFAPLQSAEHPAPAATIDRFYDVDVTVWAELGRVTMSLGELMQLGPGAVLRLGRSVTAPVDLMAQGVRFATGEVVVVDDCFAVRIKEVDSSRRHDA